MSINKLLYMSFFYLSLSASANERWLSVDVELTDKVRIGNVSQFDPTSLAFDDGVQVSAIGESPSIQSVGAYLFETGLADRPTTSELALDSSTGVNIQVGIAGENTPESKIKFKANVLALDGKSLGTHSLLFNAGIRMSQAKLVPVFSIGAKCLLLVGKKYEFPTFYFSRQRFSPFKDLKAYEAHRKNDLRKIVSIERGVWSAHEWVKIRALGYQDRPYYTAAVVHQGRVYLASFFDNGYTEESSLSCLAYNAIAISDLTNFFKN